MKSCLNCKKCLSKTKDHYGLDYYPRTCGEGMLFDRFIVYNCKRFIPKEYKQLELQFNQIIN